MKTYPFLILILSFFACKEAPTYNPFDDRFNVSVRDLIRDGCDTIPSQCDYYNLTRPFGRLRPYYQIYEPDFYTVVAKGFAFRIDTFRFLKNDYPNEVELDSIIDLPFDTFELNKDFGEFGYEFLSKEQDSITIYNRQKRDSIKLELIAFPIFDNRYILRGISYYRGIN